MSSKITRRTFIGVLGLSGLTIATACSTGAPSGTPSGPPSASTPSTKQDGVPTLVLVTDTGTIQDQSFNELAWAGMSSLHARHGWNVSYIDSLENPEYEPRLDEAVASGADLVWGMGFSMQDAIEEAARKYPDTKFAIIDAAYEDAPPNLTGIVFHQEQCSFLVGYIAARMTKVGKVGFIGGIDSTSMQEFEQGYYAGIEYANKEQGLNVTYVGEWADSFTDSNLGYTMAQAMAQDGCDVIYHASGAVGLGVIKACSEVGVWVIGVDQDQSYLAPETVISSAVKRVDQAIETVSEQIINGELTGGTNVTLGVAEGGVGAATTHDLLPDALYNDMLDLTEKVKAGEITVPKNADELEDFIASL
ncbi:MAG: BMP family ABC transporter substrate-binding protein [Eggerthellaceae bacterium]|nr:BMP family ABC transporter substrate-binding protein [Eggerthellaceae bacterium]